MNNDEQAIRDLIATWHRATAAGNVERVLELMSEDVVFLVAGQPPMRGRQSFADGLVTLLKTHRIESESNVQGIEVSGGLAYCWTQLTVNVIPLQGGSSVTRAGNTLSVLHKLPNGAWVIIRDANLLSIAPAQSK